MPAMIVFIGCLLTVGGEPAATRGDARYLPTRAVTLAVQAEANEIVQGVRIFVSCDEALSWSEVAAAIRERSVRFELPGDGRYECFVVLENEAGESSGAPTPGVAPHAVVIVDTTAPILQIHRVQTARGSAGERSLRLGLTLLEENLGETGLRLFYRSTVKSPWIDAGPVHVVERNILWSIPESLAGVIDVRVTATDLAGNRCSDEIHRVPIGVSPEKSEPPGIKATSQPASAPSNAQDAGEAASRKIPDPYALAADLSPLGVSRLVDEFDTGRPRLPSSRPTEDEAALSPGERAIQRLRRQASQFRAEGRLTLAAARLREAQTLRPDSPELGNDYGNVLLDGGEFAAAHEQFEKVLAQDSDNLEALGGLARLAFDEHRFEDARRFLTRRMRRGPVRAEDYLLAGDIELRLGNRATARTSWMQGLRAAERDTALKLRIQRRLDSVAP